MQVSKWLKRFGGPTAASVPVAAAVGAAGGPAAEVAPEAGGPEPIVSVLSDEQRACWADNGFVVLPRFFDPYRVGAINDIVDHLWATRADEPTPLAVDVFIGTGAERRIRLRDAPDEARAVPYKLNDLYLESATVRDLVLDRRLIEVLGELLEGDPLVCNSLSFERGSQQRFHFDTFYMPPPQPNRLVATWIALEDASEMAGPLRYYPGSHLIPPYSFSHGGLSAVVAEMDEFDAYITAAIAERGLEIAEFPAKAGDVFIWHAQLYHSGAEIEDMSLTRRSVVTHYHRAGDVDPAQVVDVGDGRYYLGRAHQDTA